MREFDADIVIEKNGLKYVEIPFNAKEEFGIEKGTIFVRGELDGFLYRSKLISKGGGKQILIINREMQESIGYKTGMRPHITIQPDGENCKSEIQAVDLLRESGMDAISAITQRRSIRKYLSQPVDDNIINTILNAGFCAPSAKNKRPWHFIIVRDKEMLREIASAGIYTKMIDEAPLCIAVCGDRNIQGIPELLYEDCAAAVQNMLLCAHALGLGAVWCGVTEGSELRQALIEKLMLPVKVIPAALIALGYSGETKEPVERYDGSKVHQETW